MNHKPIPQLGPATALVQLLKDHPELPPLTWDISDLFPNQLVGVHYTSPEPFEVLRQYAEVLGGSVRPEPNSDYVTAAGTRRVHALSAVWRDVRVIVRVAVTVEANVRVAA